MKILAALILCAAALSGCAVVPAYGPPGVYAAPAVVIPYGGYYGGHYRGGHGHRHYR